MTGHGKRAHSKFSASGAERWFNCPGSVVLNETVPARDSVWSLEGTKAHEVLERTLKLNAGGMRPRWPLTVPGEMKRHALDATRFILGLGEKHPGSELMVETRIYMPFIHPEMFGTFDAAVVEHFGTLHVIDYKYGAGKPVSPGTLENPNLQMLFYGMGVAAKYDWNFKRVRLWIIQPRIKGYDGPVFLELPILELREWVEQFRRAVDRVERFPKQYKEGPWCHWCNAKGKCPLKKQAKLEQAKAAFSALL